MLSLRAFQSFIKLHALFNPAERVLLAVSGGRDSVLMTQYFKQSGYEFGIAHCNFDLRGTESEDEEDFTAQIASAMEVPFYSKTFNTSGFAAEQGISVQMAARELRYRWLEELRTDFDYHYIALAHHQSDTVETIILNLTRGTGIAGMHGILPKRQRFIRPMLFLSREEIDAIVAAEGLTYCNDSSNLSTKYARNKIRLTVVPVLKELNPKLEQTFIENAKRFAELEIILQEKLTTLKSNLFRETGNQEWSISIEGLKTLHPADTLLFGLFNPYGFTEAVLKDLKNCLDSQPGKIFESASHKITIDRQNVILSLKEVSPAEQLIQYSDKTLRWSGQIFKMLIRPATEFKNKNDRSIVQLDHDLLIFPLKMRSWKIADYFYPLGMKGKKKVSDYLQEQKIPLPRKEKVGILENGNGDILWIAGYRADDRYKITPASKKIFIIEKLLPNGNETRI